MDCMREEWNTLIENLKDAGCPQEVIEEYLTYEEEDNCLAKMRVLVQYRSGLLECLHSTQKQLECLDYLLREIRKCCK